MEIIKVMMSLKPSHRIYPSAGTQTMIIDFASIAVVFFLLSLTITDSLYHRCGRNQVIRGLAGKPRREEFFPFFDVSSSGPWASQRAGTTCDSHLYLLLQKKVKQSVKKSLSVADLACGKSMPPSLSLARPVPWPCTLAAWSRSLADRFV